MRFGSRGIRIRGDFESGDVRNQRRSESDWLGIGGVRNRENSELEGLGAGGSEWGGFGKKGILNLGEFGMGGFGIGGLGIGGIRNREDSE